MRDWLHRTLVEMVPRDHRQSARDLRRRQIVTSVFAVIGAVVLGVLAEHRARQRAVLPRHRGARGGVDGRCVRLRTPAPGPDHAPGGPRRPVLPPILLGLALAGVFVVGGLMVRQVPRSRAGAHVLDHADQGVLPVLVLITALNGVAEELFFRGAAYAATTRYPVPVTTVAYTAATLATGNVMLAFAAAILGAVVGLQRRASGGILAPILTHVTWSLTMLLALPAHLRLSRARVAPSSSRARRTASS